MPMVRGLCGRLFSEPKLLELPCSESCPLGLSDQYPRSPGVSAVETPVATTPSPPLLEKMGPPPARQANEERRRVAGTTGSVPRVPGPVVELLCTLMYAQSAWLQAP